MKKITLKVVLLTTIFGFSAFSAMAIAPQVDSVATVIGITRTTAFSGCYVTNAAIPKTNPDSIAERGVCVATVENPAITDMKFAAYKSIAGVSYEPCVLTGLTPNTHYYIRAFATNVAGLTSYSAQKEFTTSANDIEAVWTLNTDMNATATGSVSASALAVDHFMSGAVGYNQNSGGNGTTTILFPAPTGLAKLTATTLNPLATFNPAYYLNFSITASAAFNINNLVFTAFGYKTGSMQSKIAYSFDNFTTADTLLTVKYNDAARTGATKIAAFPSANPLLSTVMGRENVAFPCDITVASGQTVSFRIYLWGKAGSGILAKNLIVSGITDPGTGLITSEAENGILIISTSDNQLNIESAQDINRLEIVALNGMVLHTLNHLGSGKLLNISNLNPGVYLVRAFTDAGVQTAKFIK